MACLPMALATSTAVQWPVAAVVISGILSSMALTAHPAGALHLGLLE
jgi:Cu/Ag efflux pump CusA